MAASMDSLAENGQELTNTNSDSLESFTKIEEQIRHEDEEKSFLLKNEEELKQGNEVFLLHRNDEKKTMSRGSSVDDWDNVMRKNGLEDSRRKNSAGTRKYYTKSKNTWFCLCFCFH